MALTKDQKTQLDKLLAAGDTVGATKLLAGVAGLKLDDADLKPAEPVKPPEPRAPQIIILDIFRAIHQLLGNSPALVPLINEFEEGVKPPAAEEQPAK